jgi:hypothetical protein
MPALRTCSSCSSLSSGKHQRHVWAGLGRRIRQLGKGGQAVAHYGFDGEVNASEIYRRVFRDRLQKSFRNKRRLEKRRTLGAKERRRGAEHREINRSGRPSPAEKLGSGGFVSRRSGQTARPATSSTPLMRCHAHPPGSHGPGEQGWSWRSLPAPPPPFDAYEIITSYAVHSDALTIFMTTSYRDRPGLQKKTYSFNTKHRVWRWHPWVLPFRDQGFFDSELDAWVGLHRDGYICSCELPSDIGSETPIELGTMELDWQMADGKLFRKETERHSRASLTYLGRSKFYLLESVMRKRGKAKYILGDGEDGCVLRLAMFGLKYNNKGELGVTNHKSSRSFRVTRHSNFFSPVAFWLQKLTSDLCIFSDPIRRKKHGYKCLFQDHPHTKSPFEPIFIFFFRLDVR